MPLGNLKDKLEGDEIDLSLSNLQSVPVQELSKIPEATRLDLSSNLIQSLPDDFCTLTHLVKIDLSKNQLTSLPSDFGQLVNLQHLDLLGNQLTTLPPSFGKLKSLTWMDLKGNPLQEELKKEAGECRNEEECKDCARKVLAHMEKYLQEENSETKKKKEAEEKGGSFCMAVSIGILVISLAYFTLRFGISNIRARQCDGVGVDSSLERTIRMVWSLWHRLINKNH